MADIQIYEPINISIDIKEFEENLPSLKINCEINYESLKGNFSLTFNFWVLCKDFDSFKREQIPFLNDLSGKSRFIFDKNKLIIVPSFESPIANFESEIVCEISNHSIKFFLEKFNEFESWW